MSPHNKLSLVYLLYIIPHLTGANTTRSYDLIVIVLKIWVVQNINLYRYMYNNIISISFV